MTCTAVNHVHRRAVRFDIKVPDDEENGDFTYRASGNAHLLPEYMQVGGAFLKLLNVCPQAPAVYVLPVKIQVQCGLLLYIT